MPETMLRFRIDADHPALPGHFPGRPIVPGVVLLDRLAATLEQAGGGALAGLPAVKFLAPLLPEQDAELHWRRDGARVRFRIEHAGRAIASGEAELAGDAA